LHHLERVEGARIGEIEGKFEEVSEEYARVKHENNDLKRALDS
jgi:hypothetical protein